MEELKIVGNETDFWKQMYHEATAKRKTEARRAKAYRARMETAEKALAKLRKGLVLVGAFILAAANGVYWMLVFTGR